MDIFEMERAVIRAKATIASADEEVEAMVRIIQGRLKTSVKTYRGAEALKKLKAELRDFDARTGTWRNRNDT